MRCFIAIDIDDQTRKALARLQNELQGKADIKKSDAKWVNPETIHLTLKFLGEIKDEQAVDVCNITGDVAGRHEAFELEVESVGHFVELELMSAESGLSKTREAIADLADAEHIETAHLSEAIQHRNVERLLRI